MERVAEVAVRFEFPARAMICYRDPLELSLDCPVCRRCWRTVIFREGQAEGKCTPTGHAFPGRITSKYEAHDGGVASVVYRVAYRYEPFTDAKYPSRRPSGEPSWGRVAFEVTCPECGEVTQASTQTNIVRPWTCRCKCGCVLYTERDEQPVLSSTGAEQAD
jgi:hypothetical protein